MGTEKQPRNMIEEQIYQQGVQDEKRRILALLMLDLLLLKMNSPEQFVKRAVQMIEQEDRFN
jgi:hypothetical protein